MVDEVNYSAPYPQLAVSRSGTLVYAPGDDGAGRESHLVAVTHDGQVEELGTLPFLNPRLALSPDGERLALAGRRGGQARIEALDLRRRATTSLADLGAIDRPAQAAWTPDGNALLYTRYGPVEGEIVRHVADGSVPDQVLQRMPGTDFCPWSVSPDGRFLLFSRYLPETASDLLLLDLEAAPRAESVKPLVVGPGLVWGAAISPTGEWFAYFSTESGRAELLIEKFPERGQKTSVWTGCCDPPVWSPDGRELYFTAPSTPGSGERDMMAVRIESHADLARERAATAVLGGLRDRERHRAGFRYRAGRPLPPGANPKGRLRYGLNPWLRNPAGRGAELVHRAAPERRGNRAMTARPTRTCPQSASADGAHTS